MKPIHSLRSTVPIVVMLVGLTSSAGCSSLMGGRDKTALSGLDTSAMEAAGYTFGPSGPQMPLPQSNSYPGVVLEVVNGKRHMERIPLPPESPVFVEDIIRDAKLTQKLGTIDVAILRPTSPNHPSVRMEVEFDDRGDRVMAGKNYALRPGDQIVVVPSSRQWSDKVFKNLMPFASGKR